ncbi:hypothetical protein NS331_07675 [Pseudacidovorax intermedius]|uniref:Uncharacterized protein n=1 Tax=Pseudacidovorax intermedius TaxID=433924 RepID=A0A147GZY4_9BURK|nr:hypothetical protein NS331_07675 [Pseudacidovorax intermedius]
MVVCPPARLSMMTGCFHFLLSSWPRMRLIASELPPGAKGTTIVTALSGKVCEWAQTLALKTQQTSTARAMGFFMVLSPPARSAGVG